jgi:hypothetical protein
MLRTERDFTLPVGFDHGDGELHRTGTMRLATAADEILPLSDPRVQRNESYLVMILLSRVLVRLGPLAGDDITPATIERLFAADLGYLQDLYNEVNLVDAPVPLAATCPHCHEAFEVERERLGESVATPSRS